MKNGNVARSQICGAVGRIVRMPMDARPAGWLAAILSHPKVEQPVSRLPPGYVKLQRYLKVQKRLEATHARDGE